MIKTLKKRFVLLSMTSLFVLLAVIVAGMNLINYNSVVADADSTLSILSQNRGRFPDFGGMGMPPNMSPELPYESRYFSVVFNTAGNVVQTETSRIAGVDPATAILYALESLEDSDGRGFVGQYRFMRRTEGLTTRITFLDCGRPLDAFQNFLLASCAMALVGLVVVFFVILFFAGRILRPVAESYEKQKRFITDAGHEIKTPLTIIHADADVLEMELGENEWLEDIQKQAKRLTALTNDLVYLSRMEEAERSAPMIEFPFSDVVAEAASSFQAPAQTQGKDFRCQVQPMLTLRGDEKAIYQLVSILLDNALKYSPAGGAISLTAEKQGRAIQLSVSNTTKEDLPLDDLDQLFERFYRADASRNSGTGGHGIGLSVARAIVTAHGGKIQASAPQAHTLRITAHFLL